ncbi:site-specific integrase [Halorubrum ezzemoulense]|uniref:site-specific integrase n=1 Tax=Halorubrum ezzemoulense TaxID=337243 RepID=UPI00232B81B3|nr:site-specific integrase [Halorubrum ezzemoulense]MDB2261383.1 site-specific integrase [Halorubrum ezzemoulense]MDB2268128.1 site-specific integrase [Halorubrum ezzemoulense]
MTDKTQNDELTLKAYYQLVKTAQDLENRYGFTVYMIGKTGMRTGEIAHFHPEWFNVESNVINVPKSQDDWQPKRGKGRMISISSDTADTIDWYLNTLDDTYGCSEESIHSHVDVVSEKAGIDSISPHQIRSVYYNELI